MALHVCPWWLGYFLASPLRKFVLNPEKLLAPFVKEGMTVLEPGCGMGFFTVELARMVGPRGNVVAVDLQPQMLNKLKKRLDRAQLSSRVDVRTAQADTLGISDLSSKIDLALAFYVVHEVPDQKRFFTELSDTLKPGAPLLFVEPKHHVTETDFAASLAITAELGFIVRNRLPLGRSHSAVLAKP